MQKLFRAASLIALLIGGANAFGAPLMYVDDSAGNLGTVDASTGNVNFIGNTGVVLTDIAFSPDGHLYGINFNNLYSINTTTAATKFIGNLGISDANALVFSSSGALYAAGFGNTSLYSVNTSTGAATNLGNMGFASGGDLAFYNGNFYLASSANQLVKIDLSNLANTKAVGAFGVSGVYGLATGDNNILYAVAGTTIYTVDASTGAAINPINFAGHGLSSANGESFFKEAAPSVPVPATAWLFGSGLISLIGISRRRLAA